MRTPAGTECRYFYGNYFRGRKQEECRLVENTPSAAAWTSDLCRTCPVPGILLANACSNLILSGKVEKTLLGLRKKMKIQAYCTLSLKEVAEPEVGCGQCHPLGDIFKEKLP